MAVLGLFFEVGLDVVFDGGEGDVEIGGDFCEGDVF